MFMLRTNLTNHRIEMIKNRENDFYVWRASEYPEEYDGGYVQMRLSYSPAAHLFLFLLQWTDCHFAGTLGLLRILIYKVLIDFAALLLLDLDPLFLSAWYVILCLLLL